MAAVEMGYGHVRAARTLADAVGVPFVHLDRPPLAPDGERRLWRRTRAAYEAVSRLSQVPVIGRPLSWALDELTRIPHLYPLRDLAAPTYGALALDRLVREELDRVEHGRDVDGDALWNVRARCHGRSLTAAVARPVKMLRRCAETVVTALIELLG